MKYDDASWYYGADNYPADLAPEAGGTHIGMFVAWAMLNGLAGSIHTEDFPEMLEKLQRQEITPGAWFLEACDGKFTDEDLTEEGNGFAQNYYADDDGLKNSAANFLNDYSEVFPQFKDLELYRLPDTWETYGKIAPVISRRFLKWRNPKEGWRRLFS